MAMSSVSRRKSNSPGKSARRKPAPAAPTRRPQPSEAPDRGAIEREAPDRANSRYPEAPDAGESVPYFDHSFFAGRYQN
jgi:hypothetical protein